MGSPSDTQSVTRLPEARLSRMEPDPHVGYPKAARLLRRGGRLAVLSHRIVAGPSSARLDDVVARSAPSFPLGPLPTVRELAARVKRPTPLTSLRCWRQ